ncbi:MULTISPECIES: hypothetical protein [unclassified Xanthomonas]|uniref:hypothetical protein n=1 Tax=unclassified Xanthomonas TaxID=2643310 RepID=UPI002882EC76|nr:MULTISPECIES: hypothetical protein [unclassified Xanthomonas]
MTKLETRPVLTPPALNDDARLLPFLAAVAIFLTIQLVINAKDFTGDAGAYWAISSAILEGTFPQTIRGYAYPLLLTPFRLVFDHSQTAGLFFLKAGQSIGYGYAFSILIPNLYRSMFGGKLTTVRRIIPSLLTAVVFPGLVSYPLSDAPSLGLMALSLHLAISSIRSKSFAGLLLTGIICYFTYNVRTIYLFSFISLAIVVTCFFAKDIQRKALALTFFLLGSLIGALPQMAINYKHHALASPLVVTDVRGASLFARQLTWGMVVDRYETFIDSDTQQAIPTFYANDRGAAVLEKNGGFAENQSFTKIFAMMTDNPITFAEIYLRHTASALDARDGEIYTRQPSSEKNVKSLIFLVIVTFGITQLGKAILSTSQEPRRTKALYALTLIAPCIAIVPGAIETRFFLPLYCMSYCALAFQRINSKTLALQMVLTAILTAGIYCFVADSVENPIHARPESYIPAAPN